MTILVTAGDDKLAKERLAKFLKGLRGHATQREFAKLLGTSYTAVQDWEKEIRLPKNENLKRIAQVKGWTYEQLMRHIFHPGAQSEAIGDDPLEIIIAQVRNLSPAQMQTLSDYLKVQLNELQNFQEKSMRCDLSNNQKHNLHLLLKASLKGQNLMEAMEQAKIEPEVFTDVFLRNDKNRVIGYEDLEKFSGLCCQVIQWRINQLPEIDCHQTYAGKTELLFNDLAGGGRVQNRSV
jgi:transcriptional regulator with XRE-family HTH domain